MRLFTTDKAVEDFGVDFRDLGQADLEGFFRMPGARGRRATKVDFKLH